MNMLRISDSITGSDNELLTLLTLRHQAVQKLKAKCKSSQNLRTRFSSLA